MKLKTTACNKMGIQSSLVSWVSIMSRIILCVILIVAIGVFARADLLNETDLGVNVTRIIEAWKVLGLSVTVVSKGNVSSRGYGYKDLFSSKVTEDTAFFIGSLTKAFTATLAVYIMKEHNIHLKDRVNSFYGLDLATEEQKDANMIDLLAHRVGAGSYDFFWLTRGTEEGTNVLENPITKFIDVVYQGFRSTFIFSSLMYWAAGEAIEALFSNRYTEDLSDEKANRTWCDLVTYHVINILNMIETTCEWRDTGRDGIGGLMAQQILWNGTNYVQVPAGIADQWQNVLAASGLISTARDMANWIKFNLKLYDGHELNRTLEHTHKLYMAIDNPYGMKLQEFGISFYTYGYALGWYLGNYRGFSVLYHDGRLLAHQNLIWLIPELDFGVYVGLTGGTNDTIQNIILQAMYLTDRFSGNLSKPWLNEDILINWKNLYPQELYYPPTHPHMLEPLYTCNCKINKTNSQVRYCDKEFIYYKLNNTYSPGFIHYPAGYTNDLFGNMQIEECRKIKEIMEDYHPSESTTMLCMQINKFIGEIQPTNLTDIYHVKPLGQFVYIQQTVFQRPLLIKISAISTGVLFFEHVNYKVCGLTLDPEVPPLFQTEKEENFVDVALPIIIIILPLFLLGIILNSHKTIYKKIDRYFLSKLPYKFRIKHGRKNENENEEALLDPAGTLSEREKLIQEICKKTPPKSNISISKAEEKSIFKGVEGAKVMSNVHVEIREDEELKVGEGGNGKEQIEAVVQKSKKVVFVNPKDSHNQDDV